jgi:peptide/nickel transport system ATP-binding protein
MSTEAPGPAAPSDAVLSVRDLSVVYEPAGADPTFAVENVSFDLRRGEFVGLVGESGSGKSTLGFALTRLSKPPARISHGRILFDGHDIASIDSEALREQRQGGFAMVLQSGMNALNPVRSIRNHFFDVFKAHGHVPHDRREQRARDLIGKVELPAATLDRFPGELSGGMRQRVSIALALSLEPQLMVFDEPTTALDVLVQHAVMNTIRDLQKSEGFTAVLISHDLGTVLEATERVLVMHEGVIVEDGPSSQILSNPSADYTRMLLSHYADPRAEIVSLPGFEDRSIRRDQGVSRSALASPEHAPTVVTRSISTAQESIVVKGVSKTYPPPRRGEQPVRAVRDVSFTLEPGQSLALVGQSGSGKSTIAKMITGVEKPTEGSISFGGLDVAKLRRGQLRDLHSNVQMVFQDPYAALNPLHTIEYTLMRPVVNFTGLKGDDARHRVRELLDTVGLTPVEQFAAKLPHELSGGQRQRVVIARALASDPQVIIADEPVSMLDVSLRAGVLALLEDLREKWGVSLLYITHDLLSARLITDNIMVLHDGAVVERGETAEVLQRPTDAYTVALLDAVPNPARAHGAT